MFYIILYFIIISLIAIIITITGKCKEKVFASAPENKKVDKKTLRPYNGAVRDDTDRRFPSLFGEKTASLVRISGLFCYLSF